MYMSDCQVFAKSLVYLGHTTFKKSGTISDAVAMRGNDVVICGDWETTWGTCHAYQTGWNPFL